jgi:hypothetical protein
MSAPPAAPCACLDAPSSGDEPDCSPLLPSLTHVPVPPPPPPPPHAQWASTTSILLIQHARYGTRLGDGAHAERWQQAPGPLTWQGLQAAWNAPGFQWAAATSFAASAAPAMLVSCTYAWLLHRRQRQGRAAAERGGVPGHAARSAGHAYALKGQPAARSSGESSRSSASSCRRDSSSCERGISAGKGGGGQQAGAGGGSRGVLASTPLPGLAVHAVAAGSGPAAAGGAAGQLAEAFEAGAPAERAAAPAAAGSRRFMLRNYNVKAMAIKPGGVGVGWGAGWEGCCRLLCVLN